MNTSLSTWTFALFSANIHRFLPYIPWEEHPALYARWQAYHSPRALYLPDGGIDGMGEVLTGLSPCLLVSYHLGTHGQLPMLLADRGLCFDILLDREVFDRYRLDFEALQKRYACPDRPYRWLFSDDPRVLLQIRSAIRAGKHVLIFADGNSGTRYTGASQLVEVDLLKGRLWARKGIGLISRLLDIAVQPLVLYMEEGGAKLSLKNSIRPCRGEEPETYIHRCLQELYKDLAEEIREQPWKWEAWSYLHENGSLQLNNQEDTSAEVGIDERALLSLHIEGKEVLFDRVNYCAYL